MTPETYTRDSDDEWETILPNRIDYQQPGYEYRYQKRRLEPKPEPMPEILPGDHIVSVSGEKCYFLYYTDNEAFSNGMTYYVGQRKEHWRNGIRIWEAEK